MFNIQQTITIQYRSNAESRVEGYEATRRM